MKKRRSTERRNEEKVGIERKQRTSIAQRNQRRAVSLVRSDSTSQCIGSAPPHQAMLFRASALREIERRDVLEFLTRTHPYTPQRRKLSLTPQMQRTPQFNVTFKSKHSSLLISVHVYMYTYIYIVAVVEKRRCPLSQTGSKDTEENAQRKKRKLQRCSAQTPRAQLRRGGLTLQTPHLSTLSTPHITASGSPTRSPRATPHCCSSPSTSPQCRPRRKREERCQSTTMKAS